MQAALSSGRPRGTLGQFTHEAVRALHYARDGRPRRRPPLLRRGPRLAIRLRCVRRDHLYPGRPRPPAGPLRRRRPRGRHRPEGRPDDGTPPFTLAQVVDTEDEVIAVLDAARRRRGDNLETRAARRLWWLP